MHKQGRSGNLSDLARLMGVSPACVTKWKASGKLRGLITSTGKIDLSKAKQVLPERRRYGWQAPAGDEIDNAEKWIESVDWDRLRVELDILTETPQDKNAKKLNKNRIK